MQENVNSSEVEIVIISLQHQKETDCITLKLRVWELEQFFME